MTAPNIYRVSTETTSVKAECCFRSRCLQDDHRKYYVLWTRMIKRLAMSGTSFPFQLWFISEQGQTMPMFPVTLCVLRYRKYPGAAAASNQASKDRPASTNKKYTPHQRQCRCETVQWLAKNGPVCMECSCGRPSGRHHPGYKRTWFLHVNLCRSNMSCLL